MDLDAYVDRYDSQDYRDYQKPLEREKSLYTLQGLLEGITIDGEVSSKEVEELGYWLDNHDYLTWHEPFKQIFPIIRGILADGKVDPEELEDLKWLAKQMTDEDSPANKLIKHSLQELHAVFHGILSDGFISDDEVTSLTTWLTEHQFLQGYYPYDEVQSLIASISASRTLSADARKMISAFMSDFVDFSASSNLNAADFKALRDECSTEGICAADPKIEFLGKNFCLTGEFIHGSRGDMKYLIEDKQGIFTPSVTKKSHYLIIGGLGNTAWAFSAFGRKVEKAVDMRKKGSTICIATEADFWKALQAE